MTSRLPSLLLRTLVALAGLTLLTPAVAAAQNPYSDHLAVPICGENLYAGTTVCWDGDWPLLATAKTRLGIVETLVGQPGRERGYVVLVNPLPTPQRVLVQTIRFGDPVLTLADGSQRQLTYVIEFVVPGYGSHTWDLSGDPLFVRGQWIARFLIFFEQSGLAQAITWPVDSVTVSGDIVRPATLIAQLP